MKESHVEGLTTHDGPESCGATRKSGVEALTGERAGRVFSRVIQTPGRRRCKEEQKATSGATRIPPRSRFSSSIALPRPLEFGIVNLVPEFCYELLNCSHHAPRAITPVIQSPCVTSFGSACGPAAASTGAFGQALSRRRGASPLG